MAVLLVSPVVYAAWLAWRYVETVAAPAVAVELGIGVTLLLAVHELGHVVALRRFGLQASPPAFIPFLGALIFCREIERTDATTEAWVGIAGPMAGTAASNLLIGAYAVMGHDPLLVIAFVSLTTNASLVPVPPLDGGRAIAGVTPWMWLVGVACLAIISCWMPTAVGASILVLGAASAIVRLRSRSSANYRVTRRSRLMLLGAYLVTAIAVTVGFALCVILGTSPSNPRSDASAPDYYRVSRRSRHEHLRRRTVTHPLAGQGISLSFAFAVRASPDGA